MWEDPIIKEIRELRMKHSASFNHDLRAIYDDLKEQEKRSGKTFVSYPPQSAKSIEIAVKQQLCK